MPNKDALCNVVVRDKGFNGAFNLRTFQEAAALLAQALTDRGYTGGPYYLTPSKGIPGSDASKGIQVTREDGLLKIQPGDNRTCWIYKLSFPHVFTFSVAQVCKALETPLPNATPVEKKVDVIEEAPEPPRNIVDEILRDWAEFGYGFYEVFTHLGEVVTVERIREHAEKQFALSEDLSQKFVQALANRKLVKRHMLCHEDCVGLIPGVALYERLKFLGVPARAPEKAAGAELPILHPKADLREEVAKTPVLPGVRVKQLPPGDPKKPSGLARPRSADVMTHPGGPLPQTSAVKPVTLSVAVSQHSNAHPDADELERQAATMLAAAKRLRAADETRAAALRMLASADAESRTATASLEPFMKK